MATLSEWFETEAHDALGQIESALAVDRPEPAALHRAVRALRGAAQMAREEHIFRAASALETATKALVAGSLAWDDTLRDAARVSVARLRSLTRHEDDVETQEARAAEVVEQLRAAGACLPGVAPEQAPLQAASAVSQEDEFMRFAAQEVAGIADALDRGIQQLAAAPMDRDALKAILRRQRTLLGAARLDDIPVVAEILRAVEDLTRVVAKLDVGVKQDWLDVFRVARDGLRTALEPLQRGDNPPGSNSASRLRHMRQELLERFGTGEVVSAAHGSGLVQAKPADAPPMPVTSEDDAAGPAGAGVPDLADDATAEGDGAADNDAPDLVAAASGAIQRAGGVVPVEALCYTPEDALRQALGLQDVILRATAHDADARAAAEELFDLIRYVLG